MKIGEMTLEEHELQELSIIKERLADVKNTEEWLEAQSYDKKEFLITTLSETRNILVLRKREILKGVRTRAKQVFPSGERIAMIPGRREVEVHV